MVVIDLEGLADHVLRMVTEHRRWLTAQGFSMPAELAALESWARNRVLASPSESTVDRIALPADGAPVMLTIEGAADLLAVSPSTVSRLIRRGDLAAVKVASDRRIRRDDFDAYVAGLPAEGAA